MLGIDGVYLKEVNSEPRVVPVGLFHPDKNCV